MNAIYSILREYGQRTKGLSREGKIILICTIFLGIGQGIIGLLLNLFLYQQGYKQDFIGVVTFLTAFSSTIFAIPLAYAGRKFSYSRGLALALLFLGFGNLLMVLLPFRAIILLISFIGGIFLSWGAIALAPLMTSTSKREERDFLFSVQSGLAILTSALGNYLGGLFPAEVEKLAPGISTNPYRWSLLPGIVCILLSSVFFLLLPVKFSFKQIREEAFRWDKEEKKRVFFVCIPNFLIGLGAGFLIPFFNLFFKLEHHTSDETLGMIFAVTSLFTGTGSLLVPLFSRHFGRIPVILTTQGIAIILLFPIGFSHIF
ncbi:MAG: MFS transporter, partial [bacterium]